MIKIHSNGSRWMGEEPGSVDDLLGLLALERLDWERWERCGGFTSRVDTATIRFHGNFERVSHGFSIDTDDSDLIERLITAIDDNRRLPSPTGDDISPEAWLCMTRTQYCDRCSHRRWDCTCPE